ncbi:MAG: ABC transporter permease, partial [Cyclobacteriaceae bacterium]|nr:ABC transporter permease [Cyclobacteriaceae bacterium]
MYLTLAWRNIWRNKRRSFITIGSITFAVLLACIMRSMQLGSYERMIENAARFYTGYIQVHKNGFWDDKTIDNSFKYDNSLVSIIENTPGVEVAVPRVESFALAAFGTKTKGAMVLGIVPEKENQLTLVKDKLVEGSYLNDDDKSVMIGQGLAEYLKMGIGDTIVLISQGYHGANAAGIYPVKGIMKFPVPVQNNQTIYLPLKEAQWFYNVENQLTSISLVVDKAKNVDRIVADISGQVDTDALEVMGWHDLMPDLVQGIEIDNISGKVMLWILYAVIGFGMFGTFLMMTAERMYEFGVMMSVGMKRLIMQFTIFIEMAMMTSIGVLMGVGISLPILIYYYNNPIFFTGESAKAFESFGVEAAYFFSLQPSLFYYQAWAIFFMALILSLYPLMVI